MSDDPEQVESTAEAGPVQLDLGILGAAIGGHPG
jgi:hypothetical protein